MRINPSEQDLISYHPSIARGEFKNQPLRTALIFYHVTPQRSGSGPPDLLPALEPPGDDVVAVVVGEGPGVFLAPPPLGRLLAGPPAGIPPAELLTFPHARVGNEEAPAVPASLDCHGSPPETALSGGNHGMNGRIGYFVLSREGLPDKRRTTGRILHELNHPAPLLLHKRCF
jgi:hypothetical protein